MSAGPATFTYALADLTSFSASVGAGPTLTGLSLTTDFVNPTTGPLGTLPESFTVTSLGTGGASISQKLDLFGHVQIGVITTGTVTITSPTSAVVPEPSSLVGGTLGAALALGYGWCRRRRGRVAAVTAV